MGHKEIEGGKPCIYPGCKGKALQGKKYCGPHMGIVAKEMRASGYLGPNRGVHSRGQQQGE